MSALRCLFAVSLLCPVTALAQDPDPQPTEAPDDDAVSARDAQQEEETPEQAIDRLLKTRQITLDFQGTPLEEALLFLRDLSGVPFLIHPAVPADVAVTLRLQDLSMLNALKLILASHEDLDFAIWSGAVVVKTRAVTLPPQPSPRPDAPEGSVERKLATLKLTCNFDQTPGLDVFDFLRDITGLNVVLTSAAQTRYEQTFVDLQVRDFDLARVLNLLTGLHGARWSVTDDAITVDVAQ